MKNTTTRRGFIKQVAATGVGLTIGGMSFKATSAKSEYGRYGNEWPWCRYGS